VGGKVTGGEVLGSSQKAAFPFPCKGPSNILGNFYALVELNGKVTILYLFLNESAGQDLSYIVNHAVEQPLYLNPALFGFAVALFFGSSKP
jgi:hypothetical protein